MLFAFKIFSLSRYPNFLASTRPVPSRSKNLFPSGPGCNMVKIKCFSNGLVRSPTEPSRKVKSPPPYARIPFEQYRLSDFYYYAPEIHKLDKEYCSTRISAFRTFGTHMDQFLHDGKNDQTLSKKKYFLPLHCDQTVRLFQLFSTVLKRFCPVHLKNSLVLVLALFFDQALFTDFTPKL